jgi:hypothetical protein
MAVTYDMTPVALSVVIADCAAHTCFHPASRLDIVGGAGDADANARLDGQPAPVGRGRVALPKTAPGS